MEKGVTTRPFGRLLSVGREMTSSSWHYVVSGGTVVTTTEMHSAGEPLRIVDLMVGGGSQGLIDVEGQTLLDKRRYVLDHLDALRRFLMWEPRGHHDMYGALLVQPDHPGISTLTYSRSSSSSSSSTFIVA